MIQFRQFVIVSKVGNITEIMFSVNVMIFEINLAYTVLLKYNLTFYSVRMFIETLYTSHPPHPHLYPARSHRFKKQFTDQSNIGPLCANTYMKMIDSALCKWTLYGFCRLMGLETCQSINSVMSTLPSSSNHEMLRSST